MTTSNQPTALFANLNGKLACNIHIGRYAMAELAQRPKAKTIDTPIDHWERITLAEVEADPNIYRCETCSYQPTRAAEGITRHLPATKTARIDLAARLRKHAIKADQRAYASKAALGRADLDTLIARWSERARKGKVIHLSTPAGPACYAERGKDVDAYTALTSPVTINGPEATCQACLDAAGIDREAEAKALAEETKRIAAEAAAPTPKKRGRPTSAGKINPNRRAQVATETGCVALIATYKGTVIRAMMLGSGEVFLATPDDGQVHPSLSRAACAARGTRTCNGWRFWTLEANGEKADWLRQADDTQAEAAA